MQNEAFTWDDSERGRFKEEFFPLIEIQMVPHIPWVERNQPVPPAIYDEVCRIIKQKITAGVYEPSNSSYRSRWFTVLKKDGKSLQIVHSLESLNRVTIAHSGLLLATEKLTMHFAGRACNGILDLYVGYEILEENPEICCFVFEHMNNVNHVLQHMKYAGGTFFGPKTMICTDKITIVVSVDSSWQAVGYYIWQRDSNNPKIINYVKFNFILMDECQQCYSQLKQELCGLKMLLDEERYLLWGYRNLVIETDAKYLFRMLNNPGKLLNAMINCWVSGIMLYKATNGDVKKWYWFLHHVMWADHITIRKGTGCSPYFMITSVHPTLPLDIQKATWLVNYPGKIMSTEALIGLRATALAKYTEHVEAICLRANKEKLAQATKIEQENTLKIKDYHFKPESLVLVRNTAIEASANRKIKQRYLGPMVVIARGKGRAYILAKMDGSVWQNKVATFRVMPYLARKSILLPRLVTDVLDVLNETLNELKESKEKHWMLKDEWSDNEDNLSGPKENLQSTDRSISHQ
ncbi:hypothetical protein AN958_04237 [Leucoagaricus sp. SymC.cos]|nr:hypothetical protein AN958_04237 [Leucoagaricus sp. SymC.cos]